MFFDKVKGCLSKILYNEKWTCNVCGKEIFEEGYFCKECQSKLPLITGSICVHCGRKTIQQEEYCTTCKNTITSVDVGRSAFDYKEPINKLIIKYKNFEYQYLSKIFAEYLSQAYFKNFFTADFITFVPMTKRAFRKRGFNQSKLLAESLAKIINLPVLEVLQKMKDTKTQKQLSRAERLENLLDAFKVCDRKAVKDKVIVVVDDVTTTGATAEALAQKLKKNNAKKVILLTVASVAPFDGY